MGVLIATAPAVNAQPPSAAPLVTGCAYDVPVYDAPGNNALAERGPPTPGDAHTTYEAVDLRSHGTLARPIGLGPRAAYDYDDTALLVQGDIAAGTTNLPLISGDLSAFDRLQIAAKTESGLVGRLALRNERGAVGLPGGASR